ncbi:hypothetical protein FACS1894122_01440 [Alphaproteobacteria bacterium]|nr:hypothetical protein FACS1894122_01440 [Alphaproteobacteria bacterium]
MNAREYNTSIHVKTIMDSVLRNVPNRPYLCIFCDWHSVVGDYFSSISTPHNVIASGKRKILVLKVKKGRTLEVQHESDAILRMVHIFLRGTYFSGIKVTQMDA